MSADANAREAGRGGAKRAPAEAFAEQFFGEQADNPLTDSPPTDSLLTDSRSAEGEPAAPESALVAVRDPETLIARFRDDLRGGRRWWEALLGIVAVWEAGEEEVEGRRYTYLIGGEALDWLCIAERLCDAVAGDGLLPVGEVEELVVEGRLPVELTEAALRSALGPTKYRAHLNFLYGVRVEEALQLSVEEIVQKERRCWAAGHDARVDEDVFQRIYGGVRGALLGSFREELLRPHGDRISLSELKEFTYWLFKRRVATQDPARVASDTRRGMLTLSTLQDRQRLRGARVGSGGAAGRRGGGAANVIVVDGQVIETQAVHDPVMAG